MSAPTAAAKKTAKPRAPLAHPSFKDMIAAAIKNLNDKKGSSRHAIRKYITGNYKVTETAMKSNLNKSLSKLLVAGYLAHPKNSAGRYKLCKPQTADKKVAKPKSKAPAKKKATPKKAKADGAKKATGKKPRAKKPTASKKTVKKTAGKKTVKKAAAKKPAAKKTPKKSAKKTAKKTGAAKKK